MQTYAFCKFFFAVKRTIITIIFLCFAGQQHKSGGCVERFGFGFAVVILVLLDGVQKWQPDVTL